MKCFRDEDLRADRQPEFTQLDIETSFMSEQEIMDMMENMIRKLFKSTIDVELPEKFPVISYADAMSLYGVDRPDMRIPMQMTNIDDLMKNVDFKVFSGPAQDDSSRVAAMLVPGGAKLDRKSVV